MITEAELGIGSWVKQKRLERKLSLRALSELAGIAHSSLDKAERGGGMRRDTLELVVNALAGPDADEETRESLRREALAASVGISQEMERIPDDEELQRAILGYAGPNPLLRTLAATGKALEENQGLRSAQEMKQVLDSAEEISDDEPISTSKIKRKRE